MTDKLSSLVNKYGVIGAIAVFLVWWMANDVTGTLRALDQALSGHVSETNFYLRSICLNTAQTEGQRAGCIPR
jgi:hypothetical protein